MHNRKISYLFGGHSIMSVDANDSTVYVPQIKSKVVIPFPGSASQSFRVKDVETVFHQSGYNVNVFLERSK